MLCGITMRRPKRNAVVASSSAEAQRLDEVQTGFDEGPCMEAQETGEMIVVRDAETDTRWPGYMRTVREHGLQSVVAIPLELGDSAHAAMNFYTTGRRTFEDHDVEAAKLYVEMAAKVVRVALRIAHYAEAAEHRQTAMESRTPIDLAIGIIMAQSRCTQDEAFNVLQRASSNRNVKLRVLAEELIATFNHDSPTTAFDT